ncbi:ankyrin repeat and SOCS box protein 16-like isoform X2 [Dermacentor andersoni]|uniref:ankyrin repeat and SOCS box protein 16-like isoform X2 n=1 Tax=Dermacentor andersoni TaxID=34620 RepID=UPI002415E0D8|nr:ankyrin repeat and SAM domain-containing protein 3-like isoform X2 [Dermacentor andersoni]
MASLDVAAMPAWMPASDLESAASFDVYTAASFGDVSRLRDLLNTRRDADAQNRGGWTPLMYAACSGQRAILQLLLEQGASVNLHGGRHKRTATIVAAMYGRQQCIALLHQHGADLELRDHEDRTALFHAAALGHAAVVQLLVDLGASINCVERFSGHSPLSIATDQNHDNVVEILLNAGSRFSQPATNGNTLHPARQNNIPKTSPCGLNLPPKSAVRDLADFLSHFGLSKYVPMLEAQGIDLDQFLAFGEAQLEQAGIRLVGPKRKMAIAISCWNERERQQAEHKGTVQKALR